MTDYTDLVRRLRDLHEYHAWDDDELTTYRLAADAIEQLQAELDTWKNAHPLERS